VSDPHPLHVCPPAKRAKTATSFFVINLRAMVTAETAPFSFLAAATDQPEVASSPKFLLHQ